jgi:predicted amidophosphoribosyltransferase
MVYGPVQGGLYGACQDIYPIPPEGNDLCGGCGQRPQASGDWLCAACRQELNEALRRATVVTGNPSLVLA